jgi:alkyldihydroxyacetonephosphate synthase
MGEWRSSFISAPYIREALLVRGVIVETFETAVTWSGLVPLVQHVTTAVSDAIQRVTGQPGLITVRLTHVYASGGAPYFTVVMQGGRTARAMAEQWAAVKAAASSAIEAAGGTCSHHHAVGTDHLPYFEREVGGFVRALAGAKAALDHAWCLNPGVLLRPPQALSAKL